MKKAFFVIITIIGLAFSNPLYATDTYSIDLEANSSQYLSRTDTNLSAAFPGKNLVTTTNATWEWWINYESLPTGDYEAWNFLGKVTTANSYDIHIQHINAGNVLIITAFIGAKEKAWTETGAISTGIWYHYALTYAAGVTHFYINGVEQTTIHHDETLPTSILYNTDIFGVGNRGAQAGAYIDGKMDDVRVWTVARTAAEVLANYNCELVGDETGLEAYWKLENNANDDEVNGTNDLTEVNSPVYSTTIPTMTGTCGAGPSGWEYYDVDSSD